MFLESHMELIGHFQIRIQILFALMHAKSDLCKHNAIVSLWIYVFYC